MSLKLKSEYRRMYELGIVGLLSLGAAFATVGALGMAYAKSPFYEGGLLAAAVGVFLTAISAVASMPLRTLPRHAHQQEGADEVLHLKYWGRLKAACILLNFLVLIGLGALTVALFLRLGFLTALVDLDAVIRVTSILLAALALTLSYVHYTSLYVKLEHRGRIPVMGTVLIGIVIVGLLVAGAMRLRFGPLPIGPLAGLGFFDAPFLLLMGACVAAFMLTSSRALPTLVVLFKGDQQYYRGRTYLSQRKSVVMPSVFAFTILFLLFMVLIVFGVGSAEVQQPAQIGVLFVIGIGLAFSVVMAIRLARSDDRMSLYELHADQQTKVGLTVIFSSLAAAAVLCLVALMVRQGIMPGGIPSGRWVDFMGLALLVGLGPYGFYIGYRHHHVQKLEERFPDLLRDVAASHRGGLTLSNSVSVASKGEYGNLTPEVVQMANQLSWSVPFDESLERMAVRVKTPLIERTTSLIVEASHSGGNTTDVLLAAAHDAREIKNLEMERAQAMGLYTIVIYVTFFVFLTVCALLYAQFVPVLIASAEAAKAASESGAAGALMLDAPTLEQYREFYFLAALVQAVGNGLVAGLMGTGRITDGLRHGFLMVLFSTITFAFLV